MFAPTGGAINSAVAVRLPSRYRTIDSQDIADELRKEKQLAYCLITGDQTAHHRWPATGYVYGSVADLAYVVATARVPRATIEAGADILEEGARALAAMLSATAATNLKLAHAISNSLKQDATAQTYAMAATIIVNALVFQDTISGVSVELEHVPSIYDDGWDNPSKATVIAAWDEILKINYWPIFGVSKGLAAAVPSAIWGDFIRLALTVADRLLSLQLGKNPDLIGTIFQRLISDRRFLATFYTAPSSAALLSRLMIGETAPNGCDWSDLDCVKTLKMADFACGTGTLLCALYAEIRNAVEHAGGDSSAIHEWMIEHSLFGCDVIPSATHITATQLSSAYPTIKYQDTKILTMPFGRLSDGSVALGALELLEAQGAMSTIATHAEGVGAQADSQVDPWAALGGTAVENQSFDLIAMNPPFTRLTGGGGKSDEVSRPLFAAFGTSEQDQKDMARRASRLFHDTAYHGNAGAASVFAEIVHRKIKNDGTIGLILPLAAMSGASWEACRSLWRSHYRDVICLTIASDEAAASAFSADTGVAECMIIATRSVTPVPRMLSATLHRRPESGLEGVELARAIKGLRAAGAVHTLENGPLGGTAVMIGDEKIGELLDVPMVPGSWPVARIRDHALAQVSHQLCSEAKVWLPGSLEALTSAASFCKLADLGAAGPYHLDVGGSALSGGAPRGPFTVVQTVHPAAASFPILAAHHEERERTLEIENDAEGIPHTLAGAAATVQQRRLTSIWGSRTRLHIATDLRFNANALVAAYTSRESVGGRAWPSFVLQNRQYEKLLTLWFNSTLGVLSFWWIASKAQDGRGSVTTSRLAELTVIDPRTWTDTDLLVANNFFDAFKGKHLMDIHECASDPHRAELDEFVVRSLLKVDPADEIAADNGMQLLRAKLALEPSITG